MGRDGYKVTQSTQNLGPMPRAVASLHARTLAQELRLNQTSPLMLMALYCRQNTVIDLLREKNIIRRLKKYDL